jgi:hypothetical protein
MRVIVGAAGQPCQGVVRTLWGSEAELARGLLELQLLLRRTATPIAAMLDGVSVADLRRIRNDDRYREEMLGKRDERATVAQIVKAELQAPREVELLTIAVPDRHLRSPRRV